MIELLATTQYIGQFLENSGRDEPRILTWKNPELPIWASQAADFYLAEWVPLSVLLIVPRTPGTELAMRLTRIVSQIAKHPVILVADYLPSRATGVLVREHVPHVITDRVIYAPQLGTYYRSEFLKNGVVEIFSARLSAAAYKVATYFLLRTKAVSEEWRLADWSKALAREGVEISSSSLSRAFHQLTQLEFGSLQERGPNKKFRFEERNRVFGKLLQADIETVIHKGNILDIPENQSSYVLASDTALSRLTHLSETDSYTIAMSQKNFSKWQHNDYMPRNMIEHGRRSITVEIWRGNPRFLSEFNCLNPVDLTLLMHRSRDPRVKETLAELVSKYGLDPSYLLEGR